MGLPDIYRQLFGKDHIQDGDVIDLSEHGRVGGVSTGQSFKHVSIIDQSTGQAVGISTDFEGGQVTVGLTEVEMTFSGRTKQIQIESDVTNIGMIYIGKTGVTTSTGMVQLEPGSSVSLELNDATNAIYAISDTAGQIVRKMALL